MLVEMSIKGLMLDPITNMPIVLLRDVESQRVLPIWLGPVEAQAIAEQVQNHAPARPMTHDLMRNLLVDLGVTLERVIISDLRNDTFYAFLELRRGADTVLVDSRPSDALALSIRTRARVFVEARVLDQAKSVDSSSEQADRERLQRWLESLDPDDLGYKM